MSDWREHVTFHGNGVVWVAVPLEGDPIKVGHTLARVLQECRGYVIDHAGVESYATNPPSGHAIAIRLRRG